MPLGERLFRLFWLGLPGRSFVRLAGRGVRADDEAGPRIAPASGTPGANGAERTLRTTPASLPSDRLAELERRVSDLERWRVGH
jgi:hypothetical protein